MSRQSRTFPRLARRAGVLALSWLALSATACRVPVPAATGAAPAPEQFTESGQVEAPVKWWTAFGDPQLDALMERALAGNLDLLTAWDRLAQAEAIARQAGAPLEPSLTGETSAARTRSRSEQLGTASASSIALDLVASYEVDLWGRIRATRDAAALAAQASRQDVDATALLLTAQVAGTWYALLDQLGQLELLDEQIRTNEEFLEVVTFRFGRQQVSAVDVLQQRQLLESTRAEKHRAESARRVLEHQLAVLLGYEPTVPLRPGEPALPDLPPLPATGLPASLLQRRPDVRAARLRLAAGNHDVAAAVADRFPRLTLSARAETSDEQVQDLFDNWLASIAAGLTAPLLDGDRRVAEVDRTRAAAAERLHAYGRAVLEAVQEVEDALVEERQQRAFLASTERQLELASRAAEETRARYVKGAEDYLRVLDAVQSLQRLQRERRTAQRRLIEFRIDLYRALGGGWALSRPPLLGVPAGSTAKPARGGPETQ
ncbi:MAG: efflux transporter outer membrane subunit [Planctomycetota bacterium]